MGKIAIHGFGRIGRSALKAALRDKLWVPVSISDIKDLPTLAALFTLALFVSGHLAESILKMTTGSASAVALERLTWLVPALGLFNLRGDVVHGAGVPGQRLLVIAAYAGLYSITALYAAALVFRRRDFR